ncbi:MAG: DUF5654 family protein [Candidatus Thermoplasmatota archaeon]
MAEERKQTVVEVRKTISTSLASAFGFVIALVWSNVVLGGLANAGIKLQPTAADWVGWAIFAVVATVLTVVMILLIIVISRWGSKA